MDKCSSGPFQNGQRELGDLWASDGAVDGHLTRHRFPAGPRCAENVTKILIVGGDPGASVGTHSEVLAIGADCVCARNIPDVPRDVDGASAAILGGVITLI